MRVSTCARTVVVALFLTVTTIMPAAAEHDTTPPTVEILADPESPDGLAGWYVTSPTVTISGEDPGSGIAYCEFRIDGGPFITFTGPFTLPDGDRTILARCVNTELNRSSEIARRFLVDAAPPSIEFEGNEETYGVEDLITIDCVATDGTSGIAEDTCDDADLQDVPAWELPGENELEALATDIAGNLTLSSTSFTVVVDAEGMSVLVDEFVDDPEVAESLNEKLEAIESAPNDEARAGQCGALRNQLTAQQGKSLTEDEAAILLELIDELC